LSEVKEKDGEDIQVNITDAPPTEVDEHPKNTEVLAIYPMDKPKSKWVAQGLVKIKIRHIGLEISNISYSISSTHQVKIRPPFKYYRFPDEPDKPDQYSESIKFDDKTIWKGACDKIREAVLEHHEDELPVASISSLDKEV